MKQILTIILATLISVAGYAQSETLEQALARIANLEATVNSQSQQLSKISSDLDAVLAQNLALKKNLKLKPTIAKAKVQDVLEYRVLEVVGDRRTGTLHAVISVENIGDNDIIKCYQAKNEFIDDLGNGYNNPDRYLMKINGVSDNLKYARINHHINVPHTINLTIQKFNPDAQYLKYISLEVQNDDNLGTQHAVFQNLPIKWEDGLDD